MLTPVAGSRVLQDLFQAYVASKSFQVPTQGRNPDYGLSNQERGACRRPAFDSTRPPKLQAMFSTQDQMRQKPPLQSVHQERDTQRVQQGDGLSARRSNYVGQPLPSPSNRTYCDSASAKSHLPTYDELLADNRRLRHAMRPLVPTVQTVALETGLPQDYDIFERHLFENVQQAPFHSNFDPECILVPTRGCSIKLIDHDKTWNSWVHYAIQYPDFDQEHGLFWEKLETGTPMEDIDASWLALYFAVLTVSNYASSFRNGVLNVF